MKHQRGQWVQPRASIDCTGWFKFGAWKKHHEQHSTTQTLVYLHLKFMSKVSCVVQEVSQNQIILTWLVYVDSSADNELFLPSQILQMDYSAQTFILQKGSSDTWISSYWLWTLQCLNSVTINCRNCRLRRILTLQFSTQSDKLTLLRYLFKFM